jgi:hypothetical protein
MTESQRRSPDRSDEYEIQRIIHQYCRGADRCDGELLRSVYHDDAIDDHGDIFRGSADDFVPWVLDVLRRRFVSTMHCVTNILVEVDGDEATAESYLIAHHVVAAEREEDRKMRIFGARYVDRFEWRPQAGWRIAHRVVVADWQVEPDGAFYPLPPGMPRAARDRTDLSYDPPRH